MNESQQLYKVTFKVRPTVAHPAFFELQFGILSLFLCGESAENAKWRAASIIENLPYELASEEVLILPIQDGQTLPAFGTAVTSARVIGFGICIDFFVTGTDEGNFAETWKRPES